MTSLFFFGKKWKSLSSCFFFGFQGVQSTSWYIEKSGRLITSTEVCSPWPCSSLGQWKEQIHETSHGGRDQTHITPSGGDLVLGGASHLVSG